MVKKKFLLAALGISLLLSPLSPVISPEENSLAASPAPLKWSIVDTPSKEGEMVLPSETSALAQGSNEFFYAIDIPNEKVYQSTNGGATWNDVLTEKLEKAGAALPAWDIAVAPDDPKLIAVVSDNRTAVYASSDGGENWDAITMPDFDGTLISDISFSPEYDSQRDMIIGTRNPGGSPNGDLWLMRLGSWGWENTGLDMDVTSLAFPSGYSKDGVILAIASDAAGTYLCTPRKVGDEWREEIPPVEIKEIGNSPTKNQIIFSDLALPSANYIKDVTWTVYAGYYSTTDADDAYRITHYAQAEDATVKRLKITKGEKVSLASIDYYGGTLLAGEIDGDKDTASALIHMCSNPEEIFPEWKSPSEPPTGGAISGRANALVGYAGSGNLYCATSTNYVESAADWADMDTTSPTAPWRGENFDESAFSISGDDGDTWNQWSLIDTEMTYLYDYALSSHTEDDQVSYTIYLSSRGSKFDSIWHSESTDLEKLEGTWQRVLCRAHEGDILLRLTPEDSPEEAISFGVQGTCCIHYSMDKGEKWKSVWGCPRLDDFAVVNSEMLYVLHDNLVDKGTWNEKLLGGIWEWQRDIDTGLLSAGTMTISGGRFVFVAEDEDGEGKIAYSTDSGATFEQTLPLPEPGDIHIVSDDEFNRNHFLYAASSEGGIYRWTIQGSTSWNDLNPPHLGICGLAEKSNTLYGAYGFGTVRTLMPRMATVEPSDWDSMEVGLTTGVSFKPGSLQAMPNEGINVWAIDGHDYHFENKTGCLWIYSDIIALRTPWSTSPAMGELLPCDICTCRAETFFFCWRNLPLIKKYEVWIALDEKFTAVLEKADNIIPDDLCNPTWYPPPDLVQFTCGNTYYWKVRGCQSTEGETIHSRWSPPMHFTVKPCSSQIRMHVAPLLGAPGDGSNDICRSPGFSWLGFSETTKYEFILARDAALTEILVDEEVPTPAYQYSGELDWGMTYFWQVRAVEPVPSEPAIGTFTVRTQAEPAATPSPSPMPAIPIWIWLVIAILALLTAAIIALCLIKR